MLKTTFVASLSFGLAAAVTAVAQTPEAAPAVDESILGGPTPAEAPSVESVMVVPPLVAAESIPAAGPYYEPGLACYPIEVDRHRVKRSAKELFACHEVIPVTLCVENPADCCLYSVTLCLPACCVDEAVLCGADRGVLGRGKVGYAWSCGLYAEIVFRARGDAVVVYSM